MEQQTIQAIITAYVNAVDAQKVDEAAQYLDEDFRVALINYDNSNDVKIISKETYLKMMGAGKVGGKPRTIDFLSFEAEGNAAVIRLRIESETNIFKTWFNFVRKGGEWLIIQDMPQITNT